MPSTMRTTLAFFVAWTLSALVSSACGPISAMMSAPTATATPTATPTATTTPSPTPTATPVPPTSTPLPPPPTACPNGADLIYHGNTAKMMVAFTFDVESTAGYTQQILDTLAGKGVRATFAVTGGWAQANPGLLQAIVTAGHQVMNHSMDHASFTGVSTKKAPLNGAQRVWEVQAADQAIQSIANISPSPYFRPPYGDMDASVLCDVGAAGYGYVVMWNADTKGYRGATVDQIVQTSMAEAKPGAIYIMHVASNSADALALPRIIDALRANGYSFGTVDEIVR